MRYANGWRGGVGKHKRLQSTPTDPYPRKYFGKNVGRPLDPLLARTYARQLLEVRGPRALCMPALVTS